MGFSRTAGEPYPYSSNNRKLSNSIAKYWNFRIFWPRGGVFLKIWQVKCFLVIVEHAWKVWWISAWSFLSIPNWEPSGLIFSNSRSENWSFRFPPTQINYIVLFRRFPSRFFQNLAINFWPNLPKMFFHYKMTWILNLIIFCRGSFEKYGPKNDENRIVSIFYILESVT